MILTASKRVAHRDSTAVNVHLLERNTNLLDRPDSLRSESFIDFVKVHFLFPKPSFLQDFGNSKARADTHDPGRNTDDGRSDVLADDGESETLGC